MTDTPQPGDAEAIVDALDNEEADVTRLEVDGKEILLIGTAHISQESVETVRRVLDAERPDTVCVELDPERFKALTQEQRWEDLDILEVIKKRQLTFLVARLGLMGFQKRMGSYTGVKPGAEMSAAVEKADELGAHVELVDRDVKATLLRAWRLTPLWRRSLVAFSLVAGIFDTGKVDEEELAELRQSHNITEILDEMGEALPSVKGVLVDERDLYMAHRIRNAPGDRIVAVVGAAHVPGLVRYLEGVDTPEAADAVTYIPPKSKITNILPWLLPLIVIGLFAWGLIRGETDAAQDAMVAWIVINGSLSGLGALSALAHPVTIVVAFLAAPITSLIPVIGAGWVAAFCQTLLAPPTVDDMERAGDDIAEWKGWWKNRLARIILVFIFCSVGSTVATFVAFRWLIPLVT